MKLSTLFYLILPALLVNCKDSDPAPGAAPVTQPPTITSISPTTGVSGTSVTINGTNFATSASANTVTINGKPASISSATASQLIVTVPALAGTGTVSVKTSGGNVDGPVYYYTYTVIVSTISGTPGMGGFFEGPVNVSRYQGPNDVRIGSDGNIYVADRGNNRIRKLTPAGIVSTYSGTTMGLNNGDISVALFNGPNGLSFDKNGNLHVADIYNSAVRMVTGTTVSTLAGGNGPGFVNGNGTSVQFDLPEELVVDQNGNVYVTEYSNNSIRKITPAGEVSTFAGDGTPGFADGTGTAARFQNPVGIDIDKEGNLIVADYANSRIRMITPAGVVTTLLGGATSGATDGPAANASIRFARDLTIDNNGNIFFCDTNNHKIRVLTTTGMVVTLAGTGEEGATDGAGVVAKFKYPFGIDVDANGILYVADNQNYSIRKIVVQ